MEDVNDQVKARLIKLDELRQEGINPYNNCPLDNRTLIEQIWETHGNASHEVLEEKTVPVSVSGRIIALRKFGKASFAHLRDATGKIQIYVRKNDIPEKEFKVFKKLDIGDFISVKGPLFRTKTDELSIHVEELRLLTKTLRPLPEKWHGLTDIETRCRQRYLDLVANPDVMKIFVKRTKIINYIRNFLVKKDFLEVETPMMHATAGGAIARPFITHHNTLHTDLYLRVAPELYLKRLIVGGFERIFEINRNFRNEGISNIHNPEFTMLEFYIAYKDYNYLISLTEEMISSLAEEVNGSMKFDYQGTDIDLTPPWKKINYLDAVMTFNNLTPKEMQDISRLKEVAKQNNIQPKDNWSRMVIINEIFEQTVEPKLISPTFITGYPVEVSPLARRSDANSELTDRFELFIAGREIANAFSELNDPLEQRERFQAQVEKRETGDMEAHQMDEDYLRALEHGMAPTAGEGIGIDRLVMLLTNQSSIRDVILFPQMKPL